VTFLLDANVLVYSAERGSDRGEDCARILDAVIRDGAPGSTSPAVLEEVWDLERRRRLAGLEGLTERLYRGLGPLLPITDAVFALALALKLDAPAAGTSDRIHLATCLVNDIGLIVSADRGLDGAEGVQRVDPSDRRAVDRMLAG
jgi:predicted nucleic acid-binding protein